MADTLSYVIGGVGAAAGVVGFVSSLRANRLSKRSHKLAQDAVEEARAANEFAAVANDLSRESNGIAVGAKDLAEEANTLSRRSEALETERHYVAWEGGWEGPGRWVYTNIGHDEAIEVRASLTVDGEKAEARADRVPAGGQIVLELPRAVEALEVERRELRRLKARAGQRGPYGHLDFGADAELRAAEFNGGMHWFEERVVWVSELGKQHTHVPKAYPGRLKDD